MRNKDVVNVHHFAFKRLYCCPKRRMICPRMMKLAATRGIGARINSKFLAGLCAMSAGAAAGRRAKKAGLTG